MTEWTQTVQKDGAEFSVNMTGTHVTVSTLYGSYTEKVSVIQSKLNDPFLLPAVRSMFKAMLEFYENNKEKRKHDSSSES